MLNDRNTYERLSESALVTSQQYDIGNMLTSIETIIWTIRPFFYADVAKFYNQATLVVNLSDKTQFIETFGMTALETMAAGLPVIVPTEGGIAEMLRDGF